MENDIIQTANERLKEQKDRHGDLIINHAIDFIKEVMSMPSDKLLMRLMELKESKKDITDDVFTQWFTIILFNYASNIDDAIFLLEEIKKEFILLDKRRNK
jgi:hypothetical protein